MPSNILFLVHGIGTNLDASAGANAWFAEVETALRKAWNQFQTLKTADFDDYIELCPLHYDEKFRNYLREVGDHAQRVQRALGDAEYAKLVGTLTGVDAADEKAFFWANVMDVLLYRFGGDFHRSVQVTLARQLASKVERVWAAPTRATVQFSMLTHSLGTAVAHDMLNRIAGERIGDSDALALGGRFKLRCYMTLANTSRVLCRDDKAEFYAKTLVRPTTRLLGRGYVDRFINVRHVCDPIPAAMRFQPKTWGRGYTELALRHLRDANVHGYTHYVQHPGVAAELFRTLVPAHLLPQADINAALAAYPEIELKDPAAVRKTTKVMKQIERVLADAYDDETHLLSDSVELFAKLIQRAWSVRRDLKTALGALS